MRYLIDQRQPITGEDIDRAQRDALEYLGSVDGGEQWLGVPYLVKRLLAIVDHEFGPPLGGGQS